MEFGVIYTRSEQLNYNITKLLSLKKCLSHFQAALLFPQFFSLFVLLFQMYFWISQKVFWGLYRLKSVHITWVLAEFTGPLPSIPAKMDFKYKNKVINKNSLSQSFKFPLIYICHFS